VDLLEQETVSGSGIIWAICKSASRPRQITMPASHHSVFYRPDALPATQPTASKHCGKTNYKLLNSVYLFCHLHAAEAICYLHLGCICVTLCRWR